MSCGHGDGAKYPLRWHDSKDGSHWDKAGGCSYCDHLRQYRDPDLTAESFCREPTCHRALHRETGPLCSVCKAEGLADSL